MDFAGLAVLLVAVLLCIDDSHGQKVLKRSKRNHVSCRPKSLVRYRLTVHTLWSKQTFPKMYPTYRPHAQWSSLVGRTHGSDYHMWEQGANATVGVKLFAEQGASSHLDTESVQGYTQVLDSFVAPPVNKGVGQTSAVIILDGQHSKLSFMMKIIPSPDWFIGVNGLDLCAHGRWKNSLRVDLRPFDAGTDQGLTFTAPNWPNTPPVSISAITSSFPDHPASSFLYPEYEELPRLAYLELDIVSEFRHRETFMEVPQSYNASAAEDENADTERKLREGELSKTTATTESRFARLLSNNYNRPSNRVTVGKTDSSSADDNVSPATNGQDPSNTSRINGQEMRASEVKGNSLKAKLLDDNTVYLHGHINAKAPMTQQSKTLDEPAQNINPKRVVAETSTLYLTDAHPEYGRERSSQRGDANEKAEAAEYDTSSYSAKDKEDKLSDKTFKSKLVFGITDLLHTKKPLNSDNTASTPEVTKSRSPFSFDKVGFPEMSTQNVMNTYDGSVVDCEVGGWSEWSTCSQTCGFGQQERTRNVSSYPQNGGANCPRLSQTNFCGSMRSCSWQHFSFLDPQTSKRQLREGLTRRRKVQSKRTH